MNSVKNFKENLYFFFRELRIVLDKLGPILMKKLLKALAIPLGFVADFNVISCRTPFHIQDVLFRFFRNTF